MRICGSGTSTTRCMRCSRRSCARMRDRSKCRSCRLRRASGRSSWRSTAQAPKVGSWCSACTVARRRTANSRSCAKRAASRSQAPARHRRILRSTRSRPGISLEDMDRALAEYGRLIAKPAKDGSSYGLIFVNSTQDLTAVRRAARSEEYVVEPFIAGAEATCGVLERLDGSLIALPPVEIIPAEGAFDYEAKYIAKATQEICPARFAPEVNAQLMDQALRAHRALSCRGYSRTDFIVGKEGPVYLETNTLPGLTRSSLYPKALKAEGIAFVDFLRGLIELAERRVQK